MYIVTRLKNLLEPFKRLTKTNKTLIGLVFAILTINSLFMKFPNAIEALSPQNDSQIGGPINSSNLVAVFNQNVTDNKEQAVSNNSLNGLNIAQSEEDLAGFALIDNTAFLSTSGPLKNILANKDNLMIYKVQEGDTLLEIAENFGISVNTIIWANNSLSARSLKPGQEIILLPVSGVIHKVSEGETLESIAKLYKVDVEKIKKCNNVGGVLAAGTSLIIPDAKPLSKSSPGSSSGGAYSKLPRLSNYFALPTTGWNWGRLHSYNAVDIANSCGTPVYASAEGLVLEADNSGYNSGYGEYIKIEHSNGTYTLYAHLSKVLVEQGQMVKKGDLIGKIGNTGNVQGITGCHLHFEVHGAQNPFAKY